jgi:hypothetical protein
MEDVNPSNPGCAWLGLCVAAIVCLALVALLAVTTLV